MLKRGKESTGLAASPAILYAAAVPPGLTSHISCGLRLFAIIESDEPTTHIDLHLIHPL